MLIQASLKAELRCSLADIRSFPLPTCRGIALDRIERVIRARNPGANSLMTHRRSQIAIELIPSIQIDKIG